MTHAQCAEESPAEAAPPLRKSSKSESAGPKGESGADAEAGAAAPRVAQPSSADRDAVAGLLGPVAARDAPVNPPSASD